MKEQILSYYPDVFEGIGRFSGPPFHIQLNPNVTPKQTPCHPIPVHLAQLLQGMFFQCKLDQCFGKIKNVIVIVDDIMIADKKASHSDHDQSQVSLLDTPRKCNVCLNYDKLQ